MLCRETEQRLVEIFITLSIGEEKINKLKQNIFSNLEINPMALFINLDLDKKGYLTKEDLYSFLNFFSINFIQTDIDFMFFFYDKNEDNLLNFKEFLDILISDSNYFLKKSLKKKFKNRDWALDDLKGNCDTSTEQAFLDILIEEIDLAKNLNDLIINISQCNDFVIQDVFYELKSYNYITNESLKAFFDRNEVNYNDKMIKNIFSRFNTKDINGKIVFDKFKKFFDLSYHKNYNEQIFFKDICQSNFSQNSGDIKFTKQNINTNNYIDSNTNLMNFSIPYENETNIYNNFNNNKNELRNNLFINEDDIQFKCSHLSRSGSIESFNDDIYSSNCKYIPKNKKQNNSYKNYLREKRSKSLEKSFSKSLTKIRKMNTITTNYNITHYNYDEDNFNNSECSIHEDIPVKMPIRLGKNLVKRPIPTRNKIQNNANKKMSFNFCYGNNIEDLNINRCNIKNNMENNYTSYKNSKDIYYNGCNECRKYNTHDLDLKLYQEDITTHFNNKNYY